MKIELLTKEQFKHLVYRGKSLPLKHYSDSLDLIQFFNFKDITGYSFSSPKYEKSLRFVVAYDSRKIYGVTKFAYWECLKHFGISYVSVSNGVMNRGICSNMILVLLKYFKTAYPLETFNTSEYTVSGWKFLRPKLVKYCKLYDIKFNDSIVGYFTEGDNKEEFYSLREKSVALRG